MSKRKYKENEILLIEWIDAHSVSAWMTEEEARKRPEEMDCTTIGFFFMEDEEAIRVSASVGRKGCSRDLHIIPKGMIKKIKRIKL